jgi:hypothetical protein
MMMHGLANPKLNIYIYIYTHIFKLITKYIRLGRDILIPEENMWRSVADASGLVHVT